MEEKYEISGNTLAVIGLRNGKTKVIEYDTEKILNESPYEVMDYSCEYFGSSYQGRVDGSKKMLGCNYKVPIIVEESSELIFFPTTSPGLQDCCWFSLNSIEAVTNNNDMTIIELKNGKYIVSKASKSSIENQILRATRLKYLLNDRKVAKK